jgi:hypothetical protein
MSAMDKHEVTENETEQFLRNLKVTQIGMHISWGFPRRYTN